MGDGVDDAGDPAATRDPEESRGAERDESQYVDESVQSCGALYYLIFLAISFGMASLWTRMSMVLA